MPCKSYSAPMVEFMLRLYCVLGQWRLLGKSRVMAAKQYKEIKKIPIKVQLGLNWDKGEGMSPLAWSFWLLGLFSPPTQMYFSYESYDNLFNQSSVLGTRQNI